MMRNRNSRLQSGHTLVEMIVVMAIALVIIMASFQMLEETTRATLFIESRNDLPIIAQGAVNTIQTAVSQSRQVFDSTAGGIGPGYFDALTLPVPILEGSKMPLVNTNGEFVPDKDAPFYTGNCLLVARQLSPLTIKYTDSGGVAEGATLMADRYRFELYYLTKDTSWNFSSGDGHIDAIRARSGEYADYFQLSTLTITAAQREEINHAFLNGVTQDGKLVTITQAWDPGQPIDGSFYDITDAPDPLVADAYVLNADPDLNLSDAKSITPQINGTRIFGKMNYSIAFLPTATTTFPISAKVPKYAVLDTSTPLFPSGLEFMILGNANNQRVLARMVVMAHYRANEYASQESSVITAP